MAWAMTLLPLAMLVAGFPFILILLATSATVLVFFSNVPTSAVHQVMFSSLDKYALLAVPFFIFAGELMARGGMARRLVAVVMALFGGFRGSTPITTVGAATLYGAISGSTAATVAALGPMFYPQLRKAGYSEKFSVGIITCTGFIDNIIPPSIAMILFCAAAEESVIKLFAAGIMPGLMLALLMSAYLYVYARVIGIPDMQPFRWSAFLFALQDGLLAIGAPVLIFGGLYGGVFSPTEAAGAACVYVVVITMAIYRRLAGAISGTYRSGQCT